MGCVLACFRIKGDENWLIRLLARLIPFKKKGYLPASKQPAPVPQCEGESPPCDTESLDVPLLAEEQFLESHVTVLETPAEIKEEYEATIAQTLDGDSSCPENNSAGYNILPSVEAEQKWVTMDVSPDENLRQIKPLDCTRSPYPTPLILTDEMQTPFTIYPHDIENPRTRRNARIREQQVYPTLSHVENSFQWEMLRDSREESLKLPFSQQNPQLLDLSLTPETAKLIKDSQSKETPHGDGPSFGFSAAHWDNEGPYFVSPKLWDANGIPNTTRKYKEDQKVTWHTTPFEERLEKVLTHDKLLPQRKIMEEEPMSLEDEGK